MYNLFLLFQYPIEHSTGCSSYCKPPSATTTVDGDTFPTKGLKIEVTMVITEVKIAKSILDEPMITIDSYLNVDVLRESLPLDSPHQVNMEIDISDNEAEMLFSPLFQNLLSRGLF